MKNPLVVLGSIVGCCITIPILISMISYNGIDTIHQGDGTSIIEEKNKKIINYETVDKKSPIINVYNHKLGKTQQMDIEEYLCGVLSGEMSAQFNLEALKAQAVAARTFIMYKENQGTQSKHKSAVVCTDYTHCQEYKSYDELKEKNGEEWIKNSYPKIQQAVNETKGHIITYDNDPILTLYFSTSSGKTENSEEVFSESKPYLKSVDSPYDKSYSPKYISTLQISNKDFINEFSRRYGNIQINDSNIENEIKILERSEGGAVEKIKIGNKEFKGTDVRHTLKLNSSNFEIEFNQNYITFNVKGYGHGVGMSQWGAEGMAEDGYMYYEILSHYYTETEIKDLY